MSAHTRLKLFLLLLFCLIFLTPPQKILAEWTKSLQNPIFEGTAGWWDARDTLEPSILFENNVYRMWYTGNRGTGWRIGYSSSSNGNTSWTKLFSPIIEIGSLDGFEREVSSPSIIKDGEIYKIWYSSISPYWGSGQDRFRLRYATSSDGTVWTKNPAWILTGTAGAWDSGGQNRGLTVLKVGTIFKMWYTGVDNGDVWQIGYADSPDGINWTKRPNPVLSPVSPETSLWYPHVHFDGSIYEMWYTAVGSFGSKILYAYSSDGFNWIKPADKNPVLIPGTSGQFDSGGIASPFVIKEGNLLKMWYGGVDPWGSHWKIGYAENYVTPEPTPTPSGLDTLVFLPGLGASWNFNSLVRGIPQPQNEWRMTPGLKVYDGVIQTFENAGYQTTGPDQNLFIFNYDWTLPVASSAADLKSFLQEVVNPSPEEKIDLVGHSLGGLVARTYVQNNPVNQIDQLLTLGSPHHGVVTAYYPWEGGDLHYFPGWQRIGIGILLHLRNSKFPTIQQAIHASAPVIKDILPDFNYLEQDSAEKPFEDMLVKNDWLIDLNFSLPTHLLLTLNTFVGKIADSTLRWIEVQPPIWLDKILNLWPDGRPTGEKELAEGDQTILSSSAHLNGASLVELPDLNHSDLVQTFAGQEKIMETLQLSPSEISDASQGLSYEPSLVFLLGSPVTLEIIGPDGNPIGAGDEKLVIISNPPSGNYQIKLTGTDNGEYSLHVGQLTTADDAWSTLGGSITSGQQISHDVNFQPSSPLENPFIDNSGEDFLASARSKLTSLKNNQVNHFLDKGDFEKTIESLYILRHGTKSWELKNQIQSIIDDLEHVYITTQTNTGGSYPADRLTRELTAAEKSFQLMEKKMQDWAVKNKSNPEAGSLYLLAQKKLKQAQDSSSYEAHIKTLGAQHLSIEGFSF